MTEIIRKAFYAETKSIDAESGIYEMMITTEDLDRGGDIVRAAGAQITNYMKNPVVPWGHDYQNPPVAKTLSLEIMPNAGIKAHYQFPPRGVYPFADTIHDLHELKFINAASIGFSPIESKPIGDGGRDFGMWEMLEFSLCTIGMNQNAVRLSLDNLETKVGRVLSASNERKLKAAADAINEVLAQLAPEQESITDNPGKQPVYHYQNHEVESVTTPTPNDANDTVLDKHLTLYFNNLMEILK
jgi:hypothetical protein